MCLEEKWQNCTVARNTFASQNAHSSKLICHKLHSAVARSALPIEKLQKTPCSFSVARSTCASQNAQDTPALDQILKFICPKIACCCGTKTFGTQPTENRRVRTIFWSWDVDNLHATVVRRELVSQYEQNTPCSDHFLKLERFVCNGGVSQLVNYWFTQFVNWSTSQWPSLSSSELVNQSIS